MANKRVDTILRNIVTNMAGYHLLLRREMLITKVGEAISVPGDVGHENFREVEIVLWSSSGAIRFFKV